MRASPGYALIFIALLYTTAPAVGAFTGLNFVETIHNTQYSDVAGWLSWENIGLIGWEDKNEDGRIRTIPARHLKASLPLARSDGPTVPATC